MANFIGLIPLLPLLAFAAIVLFAKRNKRLSGLIAIVAITLSWLIAWAIVFPNLASGTLTEHPIQVTLVSLPTGSAELQLGFTVDTLAGVMLFMVPFVCLMIFIYSWGYMGIGKPELGTAAHGEHGEHGGGEGHGEHTSGRGWPAGPENVDPLASRFFAYISLFATGMLGLVLAADLVTLFIFWEIMGLCSYLLIGFWFARKYGDPGRITPKQAGFKAFITTRIGDAIMLAGMMLLYAGAAVVTNNQAGLTFASLFQPQVLEQLREATLPDLGIPLALGVSVATITAILIFWGSIGKSAQFPLHVWLPDAMEGPTPVSALIHAATMVSAGVYLIIRMYPLMVAGVPASLNFIAIIGAFTAVFAATIAVAQNDIKRVLAYSTVSQLGYMFAALGVGAYVAAAFHLITHAFFKALLFLSSGSVIHGMEHGEHHVHAHGHHEVEGFDANDMRYMGGMRKRQRWTFIAFLLGGLSLAGFPIITAGFWSKDEIIAEIWHQLVDVPGRFGIELFALLALVFGAFLTAFYTWRQISMTFLGKPRTASAEHATESSWSMVAPLLILAVFAVLLGFAGVNEEFPVLGPLLHNPVHHILGEFAESLEVEAAAVPFNPLPVLLSVVLALGGLGLSALVYTRQGKGWQTVDQLDPVEVGMRRVGLGWLYQAMRKKFYFDELYAATVVRFARWLGKATSQFDRVVVDGVVNAVGKAGIAIGELSRLFDARVVDGIVNAVGAVAVWGGGLLRLIQNGRVQTYLLVAMLTVFMLLALFTVYL